MIPVELIVLPYFIAGLVEPHELDSVTEKLKKRLRGELTSNTPVYFLDLCFRQALQELRKELESE